MPKAVALPSTQQAAPPAARRMHWLLPRPGGPQTISRFRWPSANARAYRSRSSYAVTRTTYSGRLLDLPMALVSLPRRAGRAAVHLRRWALDRSRTTEGLGTADGIPRRRPRGQVRRI